jgi:hypothetical protein
VLRLLSQDKRTDGASLIPTAVRSAFQISGSCSDEIRFSGKEELIFSAERESTFGRYRFFKSAALGEGWSGSEPWGVWSNGFRAVLYLERQVDEGTGVEANIVFQLSAIFSISDLNPELNLIIDFNGNKVSYTARWPQRQHLFQFPVGSVDADRKYHRLIFDILNPISPKSVTNGQSGDDRMLGIGLIRARFLSLW